MRRPTRTDFLHTPIRPIDPRKTETVLDLVEAMEGMSFQARNLGTAFRVWENALLDPARPTILLGVAGSLMAGGLRKVLRELIAHHLVDVVVTVGSQPYQDLYRARGYEFWRSSPDVDDLVLRELFLDRLYDTLVDEEKFRETDEYLGALIGKLPPRSYTSREILEYLGNMFDDPDSWVATAAREKVPVFAPALNDSSLGIGMVQHLVRAKREGRPYPSIDPILDAYELAQIKMKSAKTAVVYLAGGVPKNYIQQTEVISEVLGHDAGGHHYALQLTTDFPDWGALSGCTFKEAQSWGKIAPNASFAQVRIDVTVGLPLLATALLQKRSLWEEREALEFRYERGELLEIRRRRRPRPS